MTCGAYYFLLRSYWPLVTAQDFAPVWPLIMLAVAAFPLPSAERDGTGPPGCSSRLPRLLLLGCETAGIWRVQSPLDNEMAPFEGNIAAVLSPHQSR